MRIILPLLAVISTATVFAAPKRFDSSVNQWTIDHIYDVDDSVSVITVPSQDPDDNEDKTLYDIITSDERFTKLAKFIGDNEHVKDILNDPDASLTLFAPVDDAFKHGHHRHHHDHDHDGDDDDGDGDGDGDDDHKHKLPKKIIRKIAHYHIVPSIMDAAEIAKSHVIETKLKSNGLDGRYQVVRVGTFGRRVIINFSKIVHADIKASNGIIHGVSHVLIPPPNFVEELFMVPRHFSTLTSALQMIDLADTLKDSKAVTVFAPSNAAFNRLPCRLQLFLFSRHGRKHLKQLLKYHVSTDLAYTSDFIDEDSGSGTREVKLPSLLENHTITVTSRKFFGKFLNIRVNNKARVVFSDLIGRNGVVHVIDHVLLPPPHHGEGDEDELIWPEFDESEESNDFTPCDLRL